MKILCKILFILGTGTTLQGQSESTPSNNDPHSTQRCTPSNSTITFRISGVLQPGDSQYVHDVVCEDTSENLGTVRMRWGHKYGHRYGGVGTVFEGDLAQVWKGNNGWITVRLGGGASCSSVLVIPRIVKIPD